MKIQLVTLGMTDQNNRKFYNRQDMGLGRALAAMGHTVDIYSFIQGDTDEIVEFDDHLRMNYLHSKSAGVHSLHSPDFITPDVDAVICFSDNQINFRRIVKRCAKCGVVCLPYVGTTGSHNTSPVKKLILDIVASNMRYYRNMSTLAKTPDVKRQMTEQGVTDIVVAPCCLDLSAVHHFDRENETVETKEALRAEAQFSPDDKIILYLARLIDEKHPLEMLDIFNELHEKDQSYRMIAIGQGELRESFEEKIDALDLRDAILRIDSIPNSEVWKYYCMADVMVNLNRVEIFGMAILEAMYYGCPVVARRAPGPEYILTDGTDGYLCDDTAGVIGRVRELMSDSECRRRITENAKRRVMNDLVWESTAQIMLDIIRNKKNKIKILHIMHEIHPSGAEMMLYNAYPYWEAECDATVMATGRHIGPFAEGMRERGYKVAFVPTGGNGEGGLGEAKTGGKKTGTGKLDKLQHLARFRRYMKHNKYDVVHIHRESLSFWYALIAKRTGSLHVVRTVHSTFAHRGLQRRIKKLTRHITKDILHVNFIAISDGVAQNERAVFGIECDEVIYNWCDNRKYGFIPGDASKEKNKLTIITVGNCGDVKNHTLLIEAMAQMKHSDAIHYIHVGYADGETEKEQEKAEGLGLGAQIDFMGSCNPYEYLAQSDLFIMTSRYEGLSIATLEAVFTGIPVLLADVPGLREFKDKGLDNVSYYEPDAGALAGALDDMVLKYRAGELKRSAAQSKRAEELYDCRRQAGKYLKVWKDLVK